MRKTACPVVWEGDGAQSPSPDPIYRLLNEVTAFREPVLITGRRSSAVLVSDQDWRSIQETLYLLSIPGMRESIREGIATPVSKCASHLKW